VAICDYDVFDTPLGRIPVNAEINYKFFRNPDCRMLDKAFSGEHSIEVQLPFVKANFPNAKIVPLLVGDIEGEKITKILDDFWDDRENAFIISSDLSHFHSPSKAVEIDAATYNLIESCGFENFSPRRACGTTSIRGLLSFAAKRGFSPVRIGAYNSGNVPGGDPFTEGNSVVGYGAWLLAECSRNKFIKDQFSDCAIDICYDSIEAHFKGEYDFIPEGIPTAFQQLGASFVTLKIGGNLRGCIGSINAHSPLIRDLTQNAYGAAFQDPRFKPLTPEEFESTEISVSLLSTPRRIVFNSEQSLLDSITPNVDGVIIRDGIFQSVYLPCVWEQLPDKSDFLESLKVKAGLPRNHFSRSLEAFKFSVECISSEK
jgi:AmmeMemoRadiSam system protein A